jgi:threonine/homoserine/homoserine lactone efflux protein
MRRAVPLITGAALTDAAYSLLAASGVLIASQASISLLTYLTPFFMLGTALIAWSPSSLPAKAGIGIALFNPATAAIWLSLSSVPALQALSPSDLLLRAVPVALGTAAWFTLLAAAAAKAGARLTPERTAWTQKLLASLLAVAGLVSLAAVLT